MELESERKYYEAGFTFGLDESVPLSLTKTIVAQLQSLNRGDANASSAVLAGRSSVACFDLPPFGSVVLKPYRRGGLLGKLNNATYFGYGRSRPAQEFDLLRQVARLGVHAPTPLAWITRGGLFYQGWLLMREIPHECSLADYSTTNSQELERVLQNFAEQVKLLIHASVYHVDLHPGNVLVDAALNTHIIDFDKACYFNKSSNKLRDLYLCRWRRAVIKHALPDHLSEYVCAYLRQDFVRAASV